MTVNTIANSFGRAAKLLAIASICAYFLLCALLFFAQRRLVFPAPTQPRPLAPGWQRVDVPGGTAMAYRPSAVRDAPVVVFFHGNGNQVADVPWRADRLARFGPAHFVAIEYPGYPWAAQQTASEATLIASAEAGLVEVVRRGWAEKSKLVLVGESLGTGVAVQLAQRGWGGQLVLVSPYTSLVEVAAHRYWFVPVGLLMRDRFDSAALAPSIALPVLVVHGQRDEVVPFALGQRLSQLFAHSTLLAVPDAGHDSVWSVHAEQKITEFVGQAPR